MKNKNKNVILVLLLTLVFTFILFLFFNKKNELNVYNHPSEKDTVNIVYITNQNYVFPLSISMRSAIKNKNPESKYHFFVIGVELPLQDIIKLKMNAKRNAKVTILNQKNIYKNKVIYFKFKEMKGDFPKKADLFKFHLSDIFPKLDKILYMDCDTIVQKDLKELYNTNISNEYAGAVGEFFSDNNAVSMKALHLPYYFNCGVMLLNLEKMKNDEIFQKLYKHRFVTLEKQRFLSQDTFNVILYPNYVKLPAQYNILTANYDEKYKLKIFKFYNINDSKYKTLKSFVYDGTILHFIKDKPWGSKNVRYAELWYKYLTEKEKTKLFKKIDKK